MKENLLHKTIYMVSYAKNHRNLLVAVILLASLVISGFITLSSPKPAKAHEMHNPMPGCPYAPKAGRTIVKWPGRGSECVTCGWGGNGQNNPPTGCGGFLSSNAPNTYECTWNDYKRRWDNWTARMRPYNVTLPPGTYQVWHYTWDDHAGTEHNWLVHNPNDDRYGWLHQAHEQYFIQFRTGTNGTGSLIANSGYSVDIPSNSNIGSGRATPFEVTLNQTARSVQPIHRFHSSDSDGAPNSMVPICAALDYVTPPPTVDAWTGESQIDYGDTVTVHWTSQDATNCICPNWSSDGKANLCHHNVTWAHGDFVNWTWAGGTTQPLYQDRMHQVTCYNSAQTSATDKAEVKVGPWVNATISYEGQTSDPVGGKITVPKMATVDVTWDSRLGTRCRSWWGYNEPNPWGQQTTQGSWTGQLATPGRWHYQCIRDDTGQAASDYVDVVITSPTVEMQCKVGINGTWKNADTQDAACQAAFGANVYFKWTSQNASECRSGTNGTWVNDFSSIPAMMEGESAAWKMETEGGMYNMYQCRNAGGVLSGVDHAHVVTEGAPTVNMQCAGSDTVLKEGVPDDPCVVAWGNVGVLDWNSQDTQECRSGYNGGDWEYPVPGDTTSDPDQDGWGEHPSFLNGQGTTDPLTEPTTVEIQCRNSVGTRTAIDTVNFDVLPPPPPTVTIDAGPDPVPAANPQTATVAWNPDNALYCEAGGDWSGVKSADGGVEAVTVTPDSATFQIRCRSLDDTYWSDWVEDTVRVLYPLPTPSIWTSSPAPYYKFDPITLHWSNTEPNTTRCDAESWYQDGSVPVPLNSVVGGLVTPQLTDDSYTYNISCYNPDEDMPYIPVTAMLRIDTIYRPPTLSFEVIGPNGERVGNGWDRTVEWGDKVTLEWADEWIDPNQCNVTGPWANPGSAREASGSEQSDYLTTDLATEVITFTIACTGLNGDPISKSQSITIINPPPTVSLLADGEQVLQVDRGDGANLTWPNGGSGMWLPKHSWATAHGYTATPCSASGDWSGSKNPSGSQQTGPVLSNKSFTMSCTGPGGQSPDSIAQVVVDDTPSLSISAEHAAVVIGGTTEVRWDSTNTTNCVSSDGDSTWPADRPTSGEYGTQGLNEETTYTITCDHIGGGPSLSESVTVGVLVPGPDLTILTEPSEVGLGGTTVLKWVPNDYVESCEAVDGPWGDGHGPRAIENLDGEESLNLNTAGIVTFTMECVGTDESTIERTATVNVLDVPPLPPVVEVFATPDTAEPGSTVNITWRSYHTTSCEATAGPWGGGLGPRVTNNMSPGEESAALPNQTEITFTIRCVGPGGEDTDSVTITGVELLANPVIVGDGSSTILTWDSAPQFVSCTTGSGPWANPGDRPTQNLSGEESLPLSSSMGEKVTFTIICTRSDDVTVEDEADVVIDSTALGVVLGVDSGFGWTDDLKQGAPLENVDLRAIVSNSDGSDLTYEFFCDVSETEPVITTVTTDTTVVHQGLCDYIPVGRFQPKVIITQGNRPQVQDLASVMTLKTCNLTSANNGGGNLARAEESENDGNFFARAVENGTYGDAHKKNNDVIALISIPLEYISSWLSI